MAGGGHYVVKVKRNQPKLLAALERAVIETSAGDCWREEEITRGRLEIRETYLYGRPDFLPEGWEHVKRVAYVARTRLTPKREHRSESFYITDMAGGNAETIAGGIRSHWGIENKLHYVKDVVMREDAGCTADKAAAANLGLFRDFAFNILKSANKSIKYATEMFAAYTVYDVFTLLLRT